jgi:hypothetical protein
MELGWMGWGMARWEQFVEWPQEGRDTCEE